MFRVGSDIHMYLYLVNQRTHDGQQNPKIYKAVSYTHLDVYKRQQTISKKINWFSVYTEFVPVF